MKNAALLGGTLMMIVLSAMAGPWPLSLGR
jgi:hypothetical protein